MAKIPWYIIFLTGFLAGLLAFWKGCEREPAVFTEYHVKWDTVYKRIEVPQRIVKVPTPYFIEAPKKPAAPDLDMIRHYKDSTDLTEDFRLYYDITTRGILTDLKFSALDMRSTIIETRTIDNTKPIRGLYLGITVGGSSKEFSTLAPSLDYVNKRNIYGYFFNVMDGSHNIRVGRKLF